MVKEHGEPIVKLRDRKDTTTVNMRFQVQGHPQFDRGASYRDGRTRYIGVETVMVRFVDGQFFRAVVVGKAQRKDGSWGQTDYDRQIYDASDAPLWLLPFLDFTSASKLLVEAERFHDLKGT